MPTLISLSTSMAFLRTKNRLLSSSTPPPTPIATAKGLKSAAVDDELLSEFLGKTLHVPDLTLPVRSPGDISFMSLLSRNEDAVCELVRCATEFGLFRIIGCGLSVEELKFILEKVEDETLWLHKLWFQPGVATDETLEKELGSERYRRFREKMEDIYGKLEVVSNCVGEILSEHLKTLQRERIKERDAIMWLYKNKVNNLGEQHLLSSESEGTDGKYVNVSDYAFTLYMSNEDEEFHVQSCKGLLSSSMRRGTVLVIVGKQLEDLSRGKFKCVTGEPVYEPTLREIPSYLIKCMSSPKTLTNNIIQTWKTITIFDQILVVILVFLLYKFVKYIA